MENKYKEMKHNGNLSKNLGMVIFIIFMGLANSCSTDNSNNRTNNAENFVVGELVYLTDNCIGVVDTDDMSSVMDFLRANDMIGIQQMVAAKKATIFAAGKQVKVIKIGFEYIQVRDVDATEMLVWIPKNMLTHEDVYGIYTSIDK